MVSNCCHSDAHTILHSYYRQGEEVNLGDVPFQSQRCEPLIIASTGKRQHVQHMYCILLLRNRQRGTRNSREELENQQNGSTHINSHLP
ncbi:hypothetical protein BaRGS_00035225 [Batillaria attramentaria]|uniref:Uncharacterized protein n=1 Tax=Batillaria attramentaria TaxID=370345 RepID=A0ABD0JFN6_9CAEN